MIRIGEGKVLEIHHSNQAWLCDHTLIDFALVDRYGHQLGRPWLTTVVDTYSCAIVGFNLGYEAPSAEVVALTLRHAILPKQYGPEYKLCADWPIRGIPDHLFADGHKYSGHDKLEKIGEQLGFICHLNADSSNSGILERDFGAIHPHLFSALPGYTVSNVQERLPEAEKEDCLTLSKVQKLLTAYIVNTYNQSPDARTGQTRIQRWEAGLIRKPSTISERDLDICLMKVPRTIQRGGLLQFQHLTYRGDTLAEHAGKSVSLRYDPGDITQVLVYHHESNREIYLGVAQVQDFEGEVLSLEDAKAHIRKMREAGERLSLVP